MHHHTCDTLLQTNNADAFKDVQKILRRGFPAISLRVPVYRLRQLLQRWYCVEMQSGGGTHPEVLKRTWAYTLDASYCQGKILKYSSAGLITVTGNATV